MFSECEPLVGTLAGLGRRRKEVIIRSGGMSLSAHVTLQSQQTLISESKPGLRKSQPSVSKGLLSASWYS